MRKSNGAAGLAALWALVGTASMAAAGPEIRFGEGDETAIVVPVDVGGLGVLPFLLDTGSDLTWVDDGVGRALGLVPYAAVEMSTIAGARRLLRSRVPRLTLGPHVMDAVEVMVGPLPELASVDAPIRGILGQSALARISYGIDYRRRRVVFEPIARRKVARVPFEWRLGRPAAVARDGAARPLALVLDAGLDQPVLFEKEGRPLPYAAIPGLSYSAATAAGGSRLRAVTVPDVRAGAIRLGALTAAVAGDTDAGGREEDGLLPTRMFASVYFDPAAGEIALEER